MANPSSGDPAKDLIGDWNLDDSAEGHGQVDSLLAFTEPRTRNRLDEGASHRPWAIDGARSGADADLFRAFSINEDDGDDDDNTDLAGAERAPVSRAPEPPPLVLPRNGEEVGGFLIVGELGRGAFARVYLAKQESLGNRLVALKVSRAEGDEPQILARLQHTHIVPIHSVHDDPHTGLRLMCMPFLGGANLAQVLEAAGARLPSEATGRSLVEALDVVSNRLHSATGIDQSLLSFPSRRTTPNALTYTPADAVTRTGGGELVHVGGQSMVIHPRRSLGTIQSIWTRISGRSRASLVEATEPDDREPDQPSRQFLREANYIHAAVWIVARLAEGLDHAHSRGLLHRDLKPSNVLIADDGTPMLLDFNLATLSRLPVSEEGGKARMGGTLPYMAPEHLDAFHPKGTTPPEAVGEAADLYALGLILYEMIAGDLPFTEPPASLPLVDIIQIMIEQRRQVPSLRAACPEVPWSLDAIVAKCLAPNPSQRYARARDLAEDLRRFLDNLPLKYTPEPSLRERVVKWVRRNPSITSSTSVALLSLVLLLGAGGIILLLFSSLQGVSARLRYRAFQSEFSNCQLRLNTTSGPIAHLYDGIKLAQQALDSQGAGLWEARGESTWSRWLTPREQTLLREQMVELILLEARAKTFLAKTRGSEADQRVALQWGADWLARAEKIDPRPTPALHGDRARYLAALGLAGEAAREREKEARTKPVTSRDFMLLGTSLLAKHDLPHAEAALLHSVALDRRRFWSWFALGHCRFEQGRYLEAAGNFAVCTALEPEFAWPYMNQGLALAKAGRLDEARGAYDEALEKNPKFIEALVDRALARLELDDLRGAEADLRQAIKLGRKEPGVLAALGEVLARLGRRDEAERTYASLLAVDPGNPSYLIARAVLRLKANPAGARADLDRVLDVYPRNAQALYVKARLVQGSDPRAALGLVDAALQADPNLGDALQLRALLRARLGNLAAIDDVERLVQAPTAVRLYNAACTLAILSETTADHRLADRALALLARAIEAGFSRRRAAADPDLKSLRGRPEFLELTRKPEARRAAG